ncbi:hypothetical protein [Streptomyces kaempferi]|uniref:Flp pilus assembly protein RcpC/CpaB domain-containing protein n=1 Tax=Streptomyces kaempferi TaxID=333725 RepID=A0ABW3XI46_9ACTN
MAQLSPFSSRPLPTAPVLPWDAEVPVGRPSDPYARPPSDPYDVDDLRPPGVDAPPTCEVPQFPPVRVRGGRYRPRCLARYRRRAVAAGLAVTAAALVAAVPRAAERARGHPASTASTSAMSTPTSAASSPSGSASSSSSSSSSASGSVRGSGGVEMVAAPVRIADAATVRLLRPGDRVDVIASDGRGQGRVVAAGARVSAVPDSGGTEPGALVVLSVPRPTAARLAGAGITARLAVTLC